MVSPVTYPVIASAAKQSSLRCVYLDCFVASLLAMTIRAELPAQGGPHGAIALSGPDHRVLDAFGLVVGARHVERHAVLVDREACKFRIHQAAGVIVNFLERSPFAGAVAHRAVKSGEKIFSQRNAVCDLLGVFSAAPRPGTSAVAENSASRSSVAGQSVKCASPQ